MGTVQKIVETLVRISDDKKGQLSARCFEHSAWMRSEFDLIRQLIKKNPRDEHQINDENVPPVKEECSSSSERNEDEKRQKRKSPEMAISASGDSPELKRNSTQDYDELATSAGLPADLNRMTKDKLLEELENRGNNNFTMKSLKKELVDALKDALLICSKEAMKADTSDDDRLGSEQQEDDVIAADMIDDAPVIALTESVKKTRNGSLMAEFRSLISAPSTVESESDRAVKLQIEYQARQQRHRQSQTGKIRQESICVTTTEVEVEETILDDISPLEVEPTEEQSDTQSYTQSAEAMDLVFSPMKAILSEVTIQCPASPAVTTVLMVLGSPAPVPSSPVVSTKDNTPVSLCSDAGTLALTQLPDESAYRSERERESMSSQSTYSTVHSSLSMAFNTNANNSHLSAAQLSSMSAISNGIHMNHGVSQPNQQPVLIKKPSNLMSGQSTFIERAPVAEKPTIKSVIVPALERARQAKLAEESKVLQKKKDLERKIATLNANSTAATGKLNSSGPLVTRPAPTSNPVRAPMSSSAPVPASTRVAIANPTTKPNALAAFVAANTVTKGAPAPIITPSAVALNPFAATSYSSSKPRDPDHNPLGTSQTTDTKNQTDNTSGTDTKGIFGFLNSSKKSSPTNPAQSSLLLSVTAPVQASVPVPLVASLSASMPVAVAVSGEVPVVKFTRRRTMEGQEKEKVPSNAPPSTPTDNHSMCSSTDESYTTAPLPLEGEEAVTVEKEKKVEDEYDNLLLSPPPVAKKAMDPLPRKVTPPPAPPAPSSTPVAVLIARVETAQMMTPGKPKAPTAATTIIPSAPLRSPSRLPVSTPVTTAANPNPALNPVTPITVPQQAVPEPVKRQVAIIEDEEEEEPEEEEENQYKMDDRGDSDEEEADDSGTDDDENGESEQEKQKRIPEWARGSALKEALEKQYGLNGHTPVDPDSIFHEVQTCSLEEIFGTKEGKSGVYSKRTSSAAWDHDSLSLIEKRTYRSQMGYGGIAAAGGKR